MDKFSAVIPSPRVRIIGNRYALYKEHNNNIYMLKDMCSMQIFEASIINKILEPQNLSVLCHREASFAQVLADHITYLRDTYDENEKLILEQERKLRQKTKTADLVWQEDNDIGYFFLIFEEKIKSKIQTHEFVYQHENKGWQNKDQEIREISRIDYNSVINITKLELRSNGKQNFLGEIKTLKLQTPKTYYFYGKYKHINVPMREFNNIPVYVTQIPYYGIYVLHSTGTERRAYKSANEKFWKETDMTVSGNSVVLDIENMSAHSMPKYSFSSMLSEQSEQSGVLFFEDDQNHSTWIYDIVNKTYTLEPSLYDTTFIGMFQIFEPRNNSSKANSYVCRNNRV